MILLELNLYGQDTWQTATSIYTVILLLYQNKSNINIQLNASVVAF